MDHLGDWDVATSISYPNCAVLDQLAAKVATIVTKYDGSRDAALEAAKKLNDVREVIASHLAREAMPKQRLPQTRVSSASVSARCNCGCLEPRRRVF